MTTRYGTILIGVSLAIVAGCRKGPEAGPPADAPSSMPAIAAASESAPPGMLWVPPGEFRMGCDTAHVDERPTRNVRLAGFWLDRAEVTNAQFADFVEATGYVTVAERPPRPEDFPGAPPEALVAGSLVFIHQSTPPDLLPPERRESGVASITPGWVFLTGACWRHPLGPHSDLSGLSDHPVVHIAWEDAVAYADWANKRLPTEAEWEYAARLGAGDRSCDDIHASPTAMNTWQGDFPSVNTRADGFLTTAPVGSFPADRLGLFDMSGNVWEWCGDWYRPDAYALAARAHPIVDINPHGPADSFDPAEPGAVKRVMRGGSFLCAESYCTGYRPTARMKTTPDTSLMHLGFRCAKDGPSD